MRAYLRFDAFSPDHEKVCVRLPNDAARWSWVVVLCKGKLQSPQGRWGSVSHVVANSARPKAHIEAMIAAGLLDVAADGSVSVHGWEEWQSNGPDDPTAKLRMKRYRERRKGGVADDRNTVTVTRNSDAQRNGQTETETEIPLTPVPGATPPPGKFDPFIDACAEAGIAYPDAMRLQTEHRALTPADVAREAGDNAATVLSNSRGRPFAASGTQPIIRCVLGQMRRAS